MSKKIVKILIISSILLGVVMLGFVALHYYVRYKIDAQFSELNNEYTKVEYDDYSLNLFTGNIVFDNFSYHWNQNNFKADKVTILGANLMSSAFSKELNIQTLAFEFPNIKLIASPEDTIQRPKKDREISIAIDKVKFTNGYFDKTVDSIQKLKIDSCFVEFNKVLIDKEKGFSYSGYNGEMKSITFDASPTQKVTIAAINYDDENASISDLRMIPKYSQTEYINHIKEERDWIDLVMEEIKIQDYELDFNGIRPLFDCKKITFDKIDLSIFRDKVPTDDHREKPMYSKMLRDLPFDLKLDSILIDNTQFDYSLLMKKNDAPGKLNFHKIKAAITNIKNYDLTDSLFPETQVLIESQFMRNSPVFIDWRFKINDLDDRFTIKGKLKNVPFSAANSFFVPEYKMRAEGTVKAMYFNFSGDNSDASGDFSVFYEDFKIQLLKKKNYEKKKFLSWFSNLFIRNKSKSGDEEIRVAHVERDPNKSFWNYFWSCLRKGLRESII